MYRTDKFNFFISLAKQLSDRLQTKLSQVQFLLRSLKLQMLRLFPAKSFFDFHATIECRFTLKDGGNMITTCNQMHRTDEFSQPKSIICPVWLNS